MRLSAGDKIEVVGNETIPEMKPGVYWVDYVDVVHGSQCYGFRKYYGRSTLVRHWTNLVDSLVGAGGGNRVDILQKAVAA